MTINIKNLRPINRDIAVILDKEEVVSESGIILKEDNKDKSLRTYEVIAVSPKVTLVGVGDKVLIPWARITIPVTVNTEDGKAIRVGFTSEDEILGVFE